MYSRLRGVPEEHIEELSSKILKLLGIEIHAEKQVQGYSGGTKVSFRIIPSWAGIHGPKSDGPWIPEAQTTWWPNLIGWAKLNFLAKTFCWRRPYWLSTFTDARWAIMWPWSWCSTKTLECCFKCSKSWCCSAFDVAFNGRMCCTLQQTCNHGQWKIQMSWRVSFIRGRFKFLKSGRSGDTSFLSKSWVF